MSEVKIEVVERGHEIVQSNQTIRDLAYLCEVAGRTCYKSEEKITKDSTEKFIRGIVKSGHESVIEHGSITVRIICDRSTSHQLVRHRIAAYSQESQRYCDYGDGWLKVIAPPGIHLKAGRYQCPHIFVTEEDGKRVHDRIANKWLQEMVGAHNAYQWFREKGLKPEEARSVLPNCTKTEVVTTFNLRQWRHVFEDRALNPRAQFAIRSIMQGVLKEFAELLPCVFEDQEARRIEMVG